MHEGNVAWRDIPDKNTFEPRKHDETEPPKLNHAQRRALTKYIAHQARAQVRYVQAKMRKAARKAEKAQHEQKPV